MPGAQDDCELAACEDAITETFSQQLTPSDDVLDCCTDYLENAGMMNAMMWAHYGDCCAAINWSVPACTPWGPPVPPKMPNPMAKIA